MLEQFLTSAARHKQALWEMKVALWHARKYERTSWRTLYSNAGVSEATARNYYQEVENAMHAPELTPDFQVVDLNTLPPELREQVLAQLAR